MNVVDSEDEEFRCPHCGNILLAPSSFVGRMADCLCCGQKFLIRRHLGVSDRVYNSTPVSIKKPKVYKCRWKSVLAGTIVFAMTVVLIITSIVRNHQVDGARDEPFQGTNGVSVVTNMFDIVKDKVVIINFDDGSAGTGFLIRMLDGVWLISNEHVLRGCARSFPKIRMMSGKLLSSISGIEVAKDRDLVRIKVCDVGMPSLGLSPIMPNIGDGVCIYGNSDGGGVVTEINGSILGVSFDKIETDAKFVPGNSGSPMIDRTGAVIGVATLLSNNIDIKDWTKNDTRFNEIRRYGERIMPDSNAWVQIPYDEYAIESAKSCDITYYCQHLIPYLLIATDGNVDEKWLNYTENNVSKYLCLDTDCHRRLMDVVKTFRNVVDTQSVVHMRQKNRDSEILNAKNHFDIRGIEVSSAAVKLYDYISADKEAEFLLASDEYLRNGIIAAEKVETICAATHWENPHIDNEVKNIMKIIGNLKQKLLKIQEDAGDRFAWAIDKIDSRASEYVVAQGTAMLYRIAISGSLSAQRKFVAMWINRQLSDCVKCDRYWEACHPWFLESFDSGNDKAALVLGDYEANRRRIKEARNYWRVSNTCRGLYNIAQSYFQAGDEKSALRYYNMATNEKFSGEDGYWLAKEGKALIYLYSVDKDNRKAFKSDSEAVLYAVDSYSEAIDIYEELLTRDPECAAYHYNLGVAFIKMFHAMSSFKSRFKSSALTKAEVNANKGIEVHIKRAAEMGYAPAISFLKEINSKH